MIFNTLDEALSDMNGLGTWNFNHLAAHYEVSCKYTDKLPKNINGYTIPLTRTMFINESTPIPYFTKCHELTHCLLDSSSEPLIEATFVANSEIEAQANYGAFYIMINRYLDETGIDIKDINLVHFGAAYNLQPKYLLLAGTVIKQAFGTNLSDSQIYG